LIIALTLFIDPGRRSAAKLLTKDEARRIAVKRIAIAAEVSS